MLSFLKRKIHSKGGILFLLFLSCAFALQAVPALPLPTVVTQPDGTEVTVYLRGDESFHYWVTEDGFPLTRDDAGYFYYASLSESGVWIQQTIVPATEKSTRTKETKNLLKTLNKEMEIDFTSIQRKTSSLKNQGLRQTADFPVSGSPKSLVILVEYTDVKFVTPNPQAAFSQMLNMEGYTENKGTGSARDYFRDNSMGVFDPDFVVVGPYELPNEMAYYGRNIGGEDANAAQMIIDACRLASQDIDFRQFDTDGDGFVDNVFVFYAGYNEAEYGPAESIWPHKWFIYEDVSFQGKRLYDYACTSELRGKEGTEMCGIGTFVHEFGHVLGLPDFYATNGGNHHTLSYWSVMDSGSYLNDGRTPPAYSAYERFFLGWLRPEELTHTIQVELPALNTSNEAYIISPHGDHNMNGREPYPVEFFVLENRQQTGWDSYLPGHGLLITRIYYNATTWGNNTVNNFPNRMGVDIIEADNRANEATLSGDPFPGTSNVSYYIPVLRSGTVMENMRVSVNEINGIIHLNFIENNTIMPPLAFKATNPNNSGFTANWHPVSRADHYLLSLYTVTEGNSVFSEHFDSGWENLIGWESTSSDITFEQAYCGENAPAVVLNEQDTLLSEQYLSFVSRFSYMCSAIGESGGVLVLEGLEGSHWKECDKLELRRGEKKIYTYEYSPSVYTRFRWRTEGNISVALDDITVEFDRRLEFTMKNLPVDNTSNVLTRLLPDLDYYYRARAVRNIEGYTAISDYSNAIMSHTGLGRTKKNKLNILYANEGTMLIYVPTSYVTRPVYVYDQSGRLITKVHNGNLNFVEIKGLTRQQFYLIHVDDISGMAFMP